MSGRAYNREITRRKARNRRALARKIYHSDVDYYDNLHQFSKNKIHCSCPMCSAKTRNKRKRNGNGWGFAPSINYKISDQRKVDAMKLDLEENI